jgi:hypothetical protein
VELGQVIANLDAWLETMRQPMGYGGPVAHWWESSYQYAGRGLDWRYQGILAGYGMLYAKTGEGRWQQRVRRAIRDLVDNQDRNGTFPASRFEANPGTLGTPHEAAATHGLVLAASLAEDPDLVRVTATRNLDHLVMRLWDEQGGTPGGFNDAPGIRGRVPNKLATLAEAFMSFADVWQDDNYLRYARLALNDVVRYQEEKGPFRGAVHQWAPGAAYGDGRFFPYYNARCVPALIRGAEVFGWDRYREAAFAILDFLDGTLHGDGSWPHVVYQSGHRCEFPHWVAPTADILFAYYSAGVPIPDAALERLWQGQLASGGFKTADGFNRRFHRGPGLGLPDFRDVTPVVGWNDKVLRLAAALLPPGAHIPAPSTAPVEAAAEVGGTPVLFRESSTRMGFYDLAAARPLYRWNKSSPWATICDARFIRC